MEKSFAEQQKTAKTAKLFCLENFMVYGMRVSNACNTEFRLLIILGDESIRLVRLCHRLYTPYGCETAARANIFIMEYQCLCSVPYAYLYHTRMVHTIHVYAYGITIRVWYGLLYHTRMVHIVSS